MSIIFSSRSNDWETPRWLFETYDKIWNFGVDVAASHNNNKCPFYFTKEDDALKNPWSRLIEEKGLTEEDRINGSSLTHKMAAWCNPPYGRDVNRWVSKCIAESKHREVAMLLYSRTDTTYFHDMILPNAYEVHFIRGRLKFSSPDGVRGPATAASMVVLFCGDPWSVKPTFHSVEDGGEPELIGRGAWP